jgi:hypothetical protein
MRLGRVKIAAGQPSRLRPFELSATFHAPSIPIDPYDARAIIPTRSAEIPRRTFAFAAPLLYDHEQGSLPPALVESLSLTGRSH